MAARVTITASILALPSQPSASSQTLDLSDTQGGTTFSVVDGDASAQVATAGAVGAAFVDLDAPLIVEQFAIRSVNGSDVAIRFNGAVAQVGGTGGTFSPGAKACSIGVDVAAPVSVLFEVGDTTVLACARRINAILGAIVATVVGGQLLLKGALSGGASAKAKGIQYGAIVLADVDAGVLASLGLVAGTTYGSGDDVRTKGRFLHEPSTAAGFAVSRVEVSGQAEIQTHLAGRMA